MIEPTDAARAPLPAKPGWVMPEPPGERCKPYAYCVGEADGWDLYWATPEQAADGEYWAYNDDQDPDDPGWPFGDAEFARQSDFDALGFLDPEA